MHVVNGPGPRTQLTTLSIARPSSSASQSSPAYLGSATSAQVSVTAGSNSSLSMSVASMVIVFPFVLTAGNTANGTGPLTREPCRVSSPTLTPVTRCRPRPPDRLRGRVGDYLSGTSCGTGPGKSSKVQVDPVSGLCIRLSPPLRSCAASSTGLGSWCGLGRRRGRSASTVTTPEQT